MDKKEKKVLNTTWDDGDSRENDESCNEEDNENFYWLRLATVEDNEARENEIDTNEGREEENEVQKAYEE